MIDQEDISIIEKLGEFPDREVKFWCIVFDKRYWRYSKVVWKHYDIDWEWNERYRFIDEWENAFIGDLTWKEIIGQWHLGSLLLRLEENTEWLSIDIGEGKMLIIVILEWNEDEEGTPKRSDSIFIDISLPAMSRSKETKQKVLQFMKDISLDRNQK